MPAGPTTLLPTKLVPIRPARVLVRPRLHRQLDASADRPCTVVFGPRGAGATTLVSSWLRRRQGPYGWISVDAGDNEPRRFWQHFVGSLRHLNPRFGDAALESFQDEPTSHEYLSLLLRDIQAMPAHTVIALDDVDALVAPRVMDALGYLIRHLGRSVRVVLTAHKRVVPGWAWLREHNLLAEIGPDQLALSDAEVRDLLPLLGVKALSRQDSALVRAATDGWVVGAVLLGQELARKQHTADLHTRLARAEAVVDDYLSAAIIDGLDPVDREFLTVTSMFDVLTVDHCRGVSLRVDAGAMLRSLAARQVFLTDLGDSAYRCNPLIRRTLQRRLAERDAATAAVLQARAAACLAADGDSCGAIALFVTAGRYDDALSVVVRDTIDVLRYRKKRFGSELANVVDPDYQRFLAASPYRCYAMAACAAAFGRADDAVRWLNHTALPPGRTMVLRTVLESMRGDPAAALSAVRLTTDAAHEGTAGSDQPAHASCPWLVDLDASLVARVFSIRLRAQLDVGDLEGAHDYAAWAPPSKVGDVLDGVINPGALARTVLAHGELDQADRLAETALAEADWIEPLDRAAVLDALVARASLLYERNDLVAADRVIREAIKVARDNRAWLTEVRCELELARVQFARGLSTDALGRVTSLGARMRETRGPAFLEAFRLAVETSMRLRLGQATIARTKVDLLPGDLAAPLRVRLALLGGDRVTALRHLEHIGVRTRWQRIERELLFARSAPSQQEAITHLDRAIDETTRDDFVRVFLDEGPDMHRLLRARYAASPTRYLARLVAAIETEPTRIMPPPQTAPSGQQLTMREQQVMRYLATSLTYSTIATELHVSRNTIKKHLQHIFQKLCVTSREQAVAVGRRLGLT